MNYIDTLVDEVMKSEPIQHADNLLASDAFRRGTGGYTGEKLDVILKKVLNDLLLKCKEAVGEEKNIDRRDKGSAEANILALERIRYNEGWNSCRSTTLQNLDNLEK